jgi:hypothetical protein
VRGEASFAERREAGFAERRERPKAIKAKG